MKKLFTMLVATVCATMAYAQTDAISLNDVTIAKGGTQQVEVAINNAASKTAFQFDLALPTGVTVKEAKLNGTYGTSRHLEKGTVDGKMRFLSYDDANALLADGAKVLVTLEATTEAETAALTANGIVVVDPEAASVGDGQTASATITVSSDATIEIPAGGKTTFVSSVDLDFSSLTDVKAYIATAYDKSTNEVWLTRVMDVPANTPIWVSGPASSTQTIPGGTSQTYYPANLLVGSATASVDIPAESDAYLNWTLGKDGSLAKRESGITGFPAGKAYLHLPKTIASSVTSAQSVALTAKGNKRAYVAPCDLDFSEVDGLKAYSVTGFAKDGTIWLTRVMKVSVNTPVYLKGESSEPYSIPSSAVEMFVVNMLKGDAVNPTALNVVDGEFTTCVLSKSEGEYLPLGSNVAAFPAGTAYLPLPTSYIAPATTRSSNGLSAAVYTELEPEVIKISLNSITGDAGTTGISRVAAEAGNDTWYNLNGQRIDTPTKKGLYIKNGKKVIVK